MEREIADVHRREREVVVAFEREQRSEIAFEQPDARIVARQAALDRIADIGKQRLERRAVHADRPRGRVVERMDRAFAAAFHHHGSAPRIAIEAAHAFDLPAPAAADADRDKVAPVREVLALARERCRRALEMAEADLAEASRNHRALAAVGRTVHEIELHVELHEALLPAHDLAGGKRSAGNTNWIRERRSHGCFSVASCIRCLSVTAPAGMVHGGRGCMRSAYS